MFRSTNPHGRTARTASTDGRRYPGMFQYFSTGLAAMELPIDKASCICCDWSITGKKRTDRWDREKKWAKYQKRKKKRKLGPLEGKERLERKKSEMLTGINHCGGGGCRADILILFFFRANEALAFFFSASRQFTFFSFQPLLFFKGTELPPLFFWYFAHFFSLSHLSVLFFLCWLGCFIFFLLSMSLPFFSLDFAPPAHNN